jgi:Ser/Thr protein kinase RdoA (MazF antagonist)
MTMRLSKEALLSALHAWPLPSPRLVRRLPAGFTSEVWLVEAGGAHFVAKYADQSQEALEAGLFAAELAERHGITSGAPLRTKEGALSLLVTEPSGQRHPLALLRFVEGSPLNDAEPGAASLYGQVLGRTHTLLQGLIQQVTLDVYDFLLQEEDYVVSQPGLAQLIRRACTAARAFEARRAVTSGVIWADRVEIVLEKETGRVGVIDWGAIERGPLLFDVALTLLWLFPKGNQASEEFLHAYLAAAPITSDELEGLPYYTALLWARQAKFFAYRVAGNVTLGDPHPRRNVQRLVEARQALEHFVAHL